MKLFMAGLHLISPFLLSQIQMVWSATHCCFSSDWDKHYKWNVQQYSTALNRCCCRETTSPPSRRIPQEAVKGHLLLLLCELLLHVGAVLGGSWAHSQERGLSHVWHSSCWHRPQGHAPLKASTAHSSRFVCSSRVFHRKSQATGSARKIEPMESSVRDAGGAVPSVDGTLSSPQGLTALSTAFGKFLSKIRPSNPACPKGRRAAAISHSFAFGSYSK